MNGMIMEMMLKQLGINPAEMQAKAEAFGAMLRDKHAEIVDTLDVILENQTQMQLQLDRIELHMLGLEPADGPTHDELNPATYQPLLLTEDLP